MVPNPCLRFSNSLLRGGGLLHSQGEKTPRGSEWWMRSKFDSAKVRLEINVHMDAIGSRGKIHQCDNCGGYETSKQL